MLAGSKHPLLLAREHWQPLAFCKLQLASMPMCKKKKKKKKKIATFLRVHTLTADKTCNQQEPYTCHKKAGSQGMHGEININDRWNKLGRQQYIRSFWHLQQEALKQSSKN
jgi:hypothetical protein